MIAALALAATTACVSACGSREIVSTDEGRAPAIGGGTREDPPPGIAPIGSGSASSSGGASSTGCPATRTSESPVDPLGDADVLGAVGVYRSCSEPQGLELRFDEPSGKLHFYRLDERYVRIPNWDGTIEVESCEADVCTVTWADRGLPARTYELELWREPTAFRVRGPDATTQEWVRIAD